MKNTSQLHQIVAVIGLVATLGACATPEQRLLEAGANPLTDNELKSLFAAEPRSATWKNARASGTIRYQPDGTQYVTWNGGEDTGSYTIRDGKICGKWKTIRDGKERCSTVYRKSTNIYDVYLSNGSYNSTLTFM